MTSLYSSFPRLSYRDGGQTNAHCKQIIWRRINKEGLLMSSILSLVQFALEFPPK